MRGTKKCELGIIRIGSISTLVSVTFLVLSQISLMTGLVSFYGWLSLVGLFLSVPTALALYRLTYKMGTVSWLPLVAVFSGLLFLTIGYMTPLAALYTNWPPIQIGEIESFLVAISQVSLMIGSILTLGVALFIFSLMGLCLKSIPKWLNWLGFSISFMSLGWLNFFMPPFWHNIFLFISVIDYVAFIIWFTVIGAIMYKLPEE